jgi:hypothetical protein
LRRLLLRRRIKDRTWILLWIDKFFMDFSQKGKGKREKEIGKKNNEKEKTK